MSVLRWEQFLRQKRRGKRWLMKNAVRRCHKNLERLKELEKQVVD